MAADAVRKTCFSSETDPYYAAFCTVQPNFDTERLAEIARESGGYEACFSGPVNAAPLHKGEAEITPKNKLGDFIAPDGQFGSSASAAALEVALRCAHDTDWSARLESVLRRPVSSTDLHLSRSVALHQLTSEFEAVCTVIAAEIVSQLARPSDTWVLPPTESVGGVAGGQKYIIGNIFFKFARDTGIYGGDEGACKAAKHELRALRQLLTTDTPGLAFPLMCTVDLVGFRLVCVSKLPISTDTLVYGSADAGRTIHASDPTMNRLMASACSSLGLGPHNVGRARVNESNTIEHDCITLWGPVDIEGHSILACPPAAASGAGSSSAAAAGVRPGCSASEQETVSRYVLDVARLYPPLALSAIPEFPRVFLQGIPAADKAQTFCVVRNRPRQNHVTGNAPIPNQDFSLQEGVEAHVQSFLLGMLSAPFARLLCSCLDVRLPAAAAGVRDPGQAKWLPCQVAHSPDGTLYVIDQSLLQQAASMLADPTQPLPAGIADVGGLSEAQRNEELHAVKRNSAVSGILGFDVNGPAVLSKDGGAVFFKLLRPEAVSSSPFALSSDAFTSFGCCTLCASGECHHGSRVEHQKVSAVTNNLVVVTLRTMAADILGGSLLFSDGKSLVREMHARGLNLCFLGSLLNAFLYYGKQNKHIEAAASKDTWLRQLIHIEMAARSLRSILNERLRRCVRLLAHQGDTSARLPFLQAVRNTVLAFIAEAFLLPTSSESSVPQHATELWTEVLHRGEFKFCTWCIQKEWLEEERCLHEGAFIAVGVPCGMLMSRFFEVSHIQETNPDVQSLLKLCVDVRKHDVEHTVALEELAAMLERSTSVASPLVARTKSMFGADLVEKSLLAYLESREAAGCAEGAQASLDSGSCPPAGGSSVFPFMHLAQPEQLVSGVLHCFRASPLVQELSQMVPHLCPGLLAVDASCNPPLECSLTTPSAYEIFTIRLMQLTQEACRKQNSDLLQKWVPTLSRCISLDAPLTAHTCSLLSVQGQCLEVMGKTEPAIQCIRRGLAFLQRYMPNHPTLGQLSCNLARALLGSPSKHLRSIAALALDDAFRVFNKLYGTLTTEAQSSESSRSISAVDVLISVLLMGIADNVGVHLGGLLHTLEALAPENQPKESFREPMPLQLLQDKVPMRDATNYFAELIHACWTSRSEAASAAQLGEVTSPDTAPTASTLHLSRSDSTALSALESMDAVFDTGGASSDLFMGEGEVSQQQAVARCIGRSKACMRMLEEFLGTPKNYFRQRLSVSKPGADLSSLQAPSNVPTVVAAADATHDWYTQQSDTSLLGVLMFGSPNRPAGSTFVVGIAMPQACASSAGEPALAPRVVLRSAHGSIEATVCASNRPGVFVAMCLAYIAGEYCVEICTDLGGVGSVVQWTDDTATTANKMLTSSTPVVGSFTLHPAAIDAGCCQLRLPDSVERSQPVIASLILRDSFGNRRTVETDKPCLILRPPSSYSMSCLFVPQFHTASVEAQGEAVDHVAQVPVYSARQLSTTSSQLPVPPLCKDDWVCAFTADTLVDRVVVGWGHVSTEMVMYSHKTVAVTAPTSNDSADMWCNKNIMPHMLAGAKPAKLCPSCAAIYARKCLRCGKDAHFMQRRLYNCFQCSSRNGLRSTCARCGNHLHFQASCADAQECSTCARQKGLQCVARS